MQTVNCPKGLRVVYARRTIHINTVSLVILLGDFLLSQKKTLCFS